LDFNGTDNPFLLLSEFFDLAYRTQIGPRFLRELPHSNDFVERGAYPQIIQTRSVNTWAFLESKPEKDAPGTLSGYWQTALLQKLSAISEAVSVVSLLKNL
jgi:hypothetical protein